MHWFLNSMSDKKKNHEGLSKSEFYGDLVYIENMGSSDFSNQFRKIITRYKRIGYKFTLM